ncbi:MAG: PEP-CTERM sorting domain-containing protein [Planctomycetota bacterium]
MNKLTLLATGLTLATGTSASAAVISSISTTTGASGLGSGVTLNYDPSAVTIDLAANVIGPTAADLASNGTDGNGIVSLDRFWNAIGDGGFFSITDGNSGTTVGNFATNGHFAFTIEAAPGFFLNLDEFTFDSATFTTNNRRGFEVYAKVDGGTFDSSDLLVDIDDESFLRANPRENVVDLSGAKYQGITSIEFRVYSLTDLSGRTVEFDDFLLTGDVLAIPEPSSLVLLALSSACMLSRRRKEA